MTKIYARSIRKLLLDKMRKFNWCLKQCSDRSYNELDELSAGYMAMARDLAREQQALEWSEALILDSILEDR